MGGRSAIVGAVLIVGCVGAEPEVERVQQPIFGGQPAATCQWPTTVVLDDGCSGTLVHPLIVTSAAHCGTGARSVMLGETLNSPARKIPVEYCRVFRPIAGAPLPNTLRDWAYCKLREPVTDVPIVPILMGCETDILKPGQKVVVAGFGA